MEDLEKLVMAMGHLAQGSPVEQVEFRMKKKDGTYAVFEGKGTPVMMGGTYTSVQVIARDITGRKQAEQSLRLQHDLSLELNKCNTLDDACNQILSAILTIGGLDSGGIYIADPATGGLDLHVNRGLSPDFVSHVSHFDPDTSQVKWAQAGIPFYGKFANIRQPGPDEIRDKEGITAAAFLPVLYEGNLIALVNVASHTIDDIPASARQILETLALWVGSTVNRIRSRMMLLESEERYRSLVENLNDVVFTVGPDWLITYVSPVAERQFGYSSSDLLGKPFTDVVFHEDLPLLLKRRLEISRGVIGPTEWRLMHPDGSLSWVRTSTRPIMDRTGSSSYFGIISNISQQKQDEEALRQANRRLTLLTSITRHDISNQLTVLMGYLDLMNNQPHDTSLNGYLEKLDTVTGRISSMIRFTKEYEEIGTKAPVWQGCRTLVDSAVKEAPLGTIRVENDLPAGLEVFADPLIGKVFYNLMDNAVRYGGKITTILLFVEKRDQNQILVCEDDGAGIPLADKENIFKRGFGKNTGMGLALTREVLDITGITIAETGKPGKGARFEMVIPDGAWRKAPV
jgi:PAS domain S-box-containing protein